MPPAKYGCFVPNAGAQPRPEAGARDERTLEGVGCSAWFGDAWEMPVPISLASGAENHVCLWINRLSLTVTTLHRYLAKADRLQHHHKLMLVIPVQPMRPELRLHEGAFFEHLEPQPEVLHLLDPVGAGGFVN